MENYDNMSMNEIIELKRAKEGEIELLRNDVRELARAEEKIVRFEDLQHRMGGSVTRDDLELLNQILDKPTPTPQTMAADGIEDESEVGTP